MNDTALDTLNSLIGRPAWTPGLAAGMLTLSFGAAVTRESRGGENITSGEIALHIQCSWRLVREQSILVGSSDYGAIDDEHEALDYIHQQLAAIFADKPCVVAIENCQASAFRLRLSSGVSIEVFPTQSVVDEYSEFWRVFQVGSEAPHFVVTPADERG